MPIHSVCGLYRFAIIMESAPVVCVWVWVWVSAAHLGFRDSFQLPSLNQLLLIPFQPPRCQSVSVSVSVSVGHVADSCIMHVLAVPINFFLFFNRNNTGNIQFCLNLYSSTTKSKRKKVFYTFIHCIERNHDRCHLNCLLEIKMYALFTTIRNKNKNKDMIMRREVEQQQKT